MSLTRSTVLLLLSATAVAAPKAPRATPAPAAAPAAAASPALPPCTTSLSHSADGRITYFRHCAEAPEMVSFRGGRYRMGDAIGSGQSYERPAHEVTIAPFAIGRYEVTRGEWQACIAAGGCTEPHKAPGAAESGERYPVASISWNQAKAYVAWLAQRTGKPYRLATESEWEYAARAGAVANYTWNWGQVDAVTCRYANVLDRSAHARHPELSWFVDCDDGYAEAAPVGSYPPNAWGVHDMQGNVWEWVEDCWHPDYNGAPADGSAWTGDGGNCRKRVNRGGGWGNGAGTLRLSNRDADPADNFSDGLGLRVALSLAPGNGAVAPANGDAAPANGDAAPAAPAPEPAPEPAPVGAPPNP